MKPSSPCRPAGRPAGGSRKILRPAIAVSLGLTATPLAIDPAHAVTYEMVTVGDAGNAHDVTGYGAVGYEYRIGKHEVTIGQYTEFLNAVDPDGLNPSGLHGIAMEAAGNTRGIAFSAGAPQGQKYGPIGNADRPMACVSWYDAARFANWMHNGQGNGSTETGAYTLEDFIVAPAKNPGALFFIPTENEWYKAAYYSPLLNSGSGGYSTYATQSDAPPGNTVGSGTNQANYFADTGFTVTQSLSYDPEQDYLVGVGAFPNSASFYGTFDQSGGLNEWNDLTGAPDTVRGLRGGAWNNNVLGLAASERYGSEPAAGFIDIGFRLASPVTVPEPTTWALAACGLASAAWGSRRRRDLFLAGRRTTGR